MKKDADRNFSCAIDDSDSKSNLLEIMFPGRTTLIKKYAERVALKALHIKED